MSKRSSEEDVDSDLADLLRNQEGRPQQQHEHGTKPMNLDHVTQGKQEFDRSNVSKSRSSRMQNFYRDYGYNNGHSSGNGMNGSGGGKASVLTTAIDYLAAYISIMCYYYPNICSGLAILAVGLFIFFLANLILNPVEEFGVMHHDFTTIRSKYDASVAKIDHWCLEGGDSNCDCEDPLTPISRMEHRSWVEAVQYNRKLVQHYTTQTPLDGTGSSIPSTALEPDVVFLGGDIVEEMDGRWMGAQRSPQLRTLELMYKNHFHKQPNGAKIDGVALGVAGDTAPNVLFRLLHGEMPDDFNPKIWWITLGMNELGRMKCSEEVVVLGILRVVEEIMERKPNARIVINSLFPMVSMRGDPYPLISDYQDSFENGADQNQRGWKDREESAEDEGDNRHRQLRQLAEARMRDRPRSGRFGEDARVRGRPDSLLLKGPMDPHQRSEEAERIRAVIAERRKRMGIFRRNPRDPLNPRLDPNRHKIHKFVPGTLNLKKRKLPLWTSIRAINKQLENFAIKNDRVTFFDVTRLFSSRRDDGTSSLSSKLITARGHPTERGYSIYEDEIVKEVTKIITEMKRKQPELFPEENGVQNQKATNDESKFYHDDIDTDDEEMMFDDALDPFSGGPFAEQMDDMVENDEGSQVGFGEPEGWGGGGGVDANEEKDDAGWNGGGGDDAKEERDDEDVADENVESDISSWEGAGTGEVSVERTESAEKGNTTSDMAPTEEGGENEGEEDVTTDMDEDQNDNVDGDGEDEDDDDDDDNAGDEEEDDDDDNAEEDDEEADDDDNEQADDADDDDGNAEEDDVDDDDDNAGEEDEEVDDDDDDDDDGNDQT